jgi:hypothetical protein
MPVKLACVWAVGCHVPAPDYLASGRSATARR